jgi:hypothetical protein
LQAIKNPDKCLGFLLGLRIGQTLDVKVVFLGYEDTAQTTCMRLMGKKIAVSQSTSGDIPDNGLDSLNTEEQSIEMELARALIKR